MAKTKSKPAKKAKKSRVIPSKPKQKKIENKDDDLTTHRPKKKLGDPPGL